MTENEKYLFERIRKGDEAAFKVIYDKYTPRIYYFVYEYIPVVDMVENIIQDTMVTLWTKRKELLDDTNLAAYLFTVAKNNSLTKLRDLRYRKKIFESSSVDTPEIKANIRALDILDTSVLAFSEIERIIEETLSQLPPQCRTVFSMSRFEEMKNREIAEELGISLKAVEGHISKALKMFRVTLKDYLTIVAFLFIP